MGKVKSLTINHQDWWNEKLKDPEFAKAYLNAVLDDFTPGDGDSKDVLILAIKYVIRALEV